MTFWGLPVVVIDRIYQSDRGSFPVHTTTNAKAFELMHEHRPEPANDNRKDVA